MTPCSYDGKVSGYTDERGTQGMGLKDKIVARMIELAGEGTWVPVPKQVGSTIRFSQTHETPEYARKAGHGRWPLWEGETYETHVFITLVAGKFIMRTCAAPWVRAMDRDVPLWLVEAVLEDPDLAHDTQRQLDMRHARRGGRSGDGVRR